MAFRIDINKSSRGTTIEVSGRIAKPEEIADLITTLMRTSEAVFGTAIEIGPEEDGDSVTGD